MERPDARKSLPVLAQEWDGCTRCDLSVHRDAVNGSMVFGEGHRRGILFLGEGPGYMEEAEGRPFVGQSGKLLRRFISHFKIDNYYITNLVACRSCAAVTDAQGNPMFTKGWKNSPPRQKFKDQPPVLPQITACSPRLYEEIYMADPIVIVALGQPAAAFLKGSSLQITKARGQAVEVSIPGAGHRAVLSAKRKEWARKVKGQLVMPVEQSQVRYLMIPTFHPAYVLRMQHNTNPNNPFEGFANDIKLAKQIYNRYHEEVSGILPEAYEEETPYNILDEMQEEEEAT